MTPITREFTGLHPVKLECITGKESKHRRKAILGRSPSSRIYYGNMKHKLTSPFVTSVCEFVGDVDSAR
jgi:hypothetical protein